MIDLAACSLECVGRFAIGGYSGVKAGPRYLVG